MSKLKIPAMLLVIGTSRSAYLLSLPRSLLYPQLPSRWRRRVTWSKFSSLLWLRPWILSRLLSPLWLGRLAREVAFCAGFWTPGCRHYPRALVAGVQKAPRHEIVGGLRGRRRGRYGDFVAGSGLLRLD